MALLSPLRRQQGTLAILLCFGLLDVGHHWHIWAGPTSDFCPEAHRLRSCCLPKISSSPGWWARPLLWFSLPGYPESAASPALSQKLLRQLHAR